MHEDTDTGRAMVINYHHIRWVPTRFMVKAAGAGQQPAMNAKPRFR